MEDKETEKIDQELAEIKMRLSIIERRLLEFQISEYRTVNAVSNP